MFAHTVPSTPLDVNTALQEGALGNRFPFVGTLKALAGIGLPREVPFSTCQWGTGITVKGDDGEIGRGERSRRCFGRRHWQARHN